MTLQVQNDQTGQVAVTYTASTGITAEVAGDLADITVGSCVRVQSATDATDGEAESDADTPVVATTVTVVAAVDGSCAAGGAGGGAGGGAVGAGRRRRARPGRPARPARRCAAERPDGARAGAGRGVVGEVSAVDGDAFTVESSAPAAGEEASADTMTTIEVTATSSTTVSITEEAGAAALTTGRCVVAAGEADGTGAVTATTLAVSDPVDGTCTVGFGGGGRGGATS